MKKCNEKVLNMWLYCDSEKSFGIVFERVCGGVLCCVVLWCDVMVCLVLSA